MRKLLVSLAAAWALSGCLFSLIHWISPTTVATLQHLAFLAPRCSLGLIGLCLASWYIRTIFLCAFFHRFLGHGSFALHSSQLPDVVDQPRGHCEVAGLPAGESLRSFRGSKVRCEEGREAGCCGGSEALQDRIICWVFAYLGCLALEGGPITWTTLHIAKHREHGPIPDESDNRSDGDEVWKSRLEMKLLDYFHWVPFVFYALIMRHLVCDQFESGLFWGACLPLLLGAMFNHWVTSDFDGCVGGTRRFKTPDSSYNSWWRALVTAGEGLNNNHHADASNPRFGSNLVAEPDPTFLFLRLLALLNVICLAPNAERKRKTLRYNFDGNKIYVGKVTHIRETPKKHQFTYDFYMMYVEINEDTPYAFDEYFLWSSSGTRTGLKEGVVARLDPQRYLNETQVREMVKKETGLDIDGRVFLLTHFTYLGLTFNPISLYYCFSKDDKLLCMISEVTNLPWGERCYYVSLPDSAEKAGTTKQGARIHKDSLSHGKKMHVSPFFGMEYSYVARFSEPGERLHLSWALEKKDAASSQSVQHFKAFMVMDAVPVNQRSLLQVLWRFPLMTWKVVFAIHWQALRLWWKGVPVVPHPKYSTTTTANTTTAVNPQA